MTAQTDTYDGTHFQVVLMNMRDGSVQGHAAGCADLHKGLSKFAEPQQREDVIDVLCKEDARAEYNSDFDEETDGWYDIDWKPCAKHVPATHVEDEPVNEVAQATIKVGSKWTYIYAADGSLIAEVRNDQYDLVRSLIGFQA